MSDQLVSDRALSSAGLAIIDGQTTIDGCLIQESHGNQAGFRASSERGEYILSALAKCPEDRGTATHYFTTAPKRINLKLPANVSMVGPSMWPLRDGRVLVENTVDGQIVPRNLAAGERVLMQQVINGEVVSNTGKRVVDENGTTLFTAPIEFGRYSYRGDGGKTVTVSEITTSIGGIVRFRDGIVFSGNCARYYQEQMTMGGQVVKSDHVDKFCQGIFTDKAPVLFTGQWFPRVGNVTQVGAFQVDDRGRVLTGVRVGFPNTPDSFRDYTVLAIPTCESRFRSMAEEAKQLRRMADIIQKNDDVYDEVIVDVLLQGYESPFAALTLNVEDEEVAQLFDDGPSKQLQRSKIVAMLMAKATARERLSKAGLAVDNGQVTVTESPRGIPTTTVVVKAVSKSELSYFCSQDPKQLNDAAWQDLFDAGYIDYPTYKRIAWANMVDDAFWTSIDVVTLGAALVELIPVRLALGRAPLVFRNVRVISLGVVRGTRLKGVATGVLERWPPAFPKRILGKMQPFGSNDWVLGIYEGGSVRAIVNRYGGRAVTDIPNPNALTPTQFSIETLRRAAIAGEQVHFDLSKIRYLEELFQGTAPLETRRLITVEELLYVINNWSTFLVKPKFYISEKEVIPPWLW